jgi:hypothetical protein
MYETKRDFAVCQSCAPSCAHSPFLQLIHSPLFDPLSQAFRFHPLKRNAKVPVLGQGWKQRATTNRAELCRLAAAYPCANAGGVIQPGFMEVDVDPRHAQGHTLAEVLAGRSLPPTVTLQTAGGGERRLYRLPVDLRVTRETLRFSVEHLGAVDGLFAGHNSVQTFSLIDGRRYVYRAELSPLDIAIATAPDWILELLHPSSAIPFEKNILSFRTDPKIYLESRRFTDGGRNLGMTSVAGSLLNGGLTGEELEHHLQHANLQQCVPPLPRAEARKIAHSMERTHRRKGIHNTHGSENRAQILAMTCAAVAAPWGHRTGKSEFAVLLALHAIAYKASSLSVSASLRHIALTAGLSTSVTGGALKALCRAGWLQLKATYHQYRQERLKRGDSRESADEKSSHVYTLVRITNTLSPPAGYGECDVAARAKEYGGRRNAKKRSGDPPVRHLFVECAAPSRAGQIGIAGNGDAADRRKNHTGTARARLCIPPPRNGS